MCADHRIVMPLVVMTYVVRPVRLPGRGGGCRVVDAGLAEPQRCRIVECVGGDGSDIELVGRVGRGVHGGDSKERVKPDQSADLFCEGSGVPFVVGEYRRVSRSDEIVDTWQLATLEHVTQFVDSGAMVKGFDIRAAEVIVKTVG